MKINVITGLSGAGKTQALKILEDFGFTCIDNLPAALIGSFFKWFKGMKTKKPIVLGLDIRTGRPAIDEIIRRRKSLNIVFLEADTKTLISRYSATRRKHPLGGFLTEAIPKERKLTSDIRNHAGIIIDTSNLTIQEFKQSLSRAFSIDIGDKVFINLISFGYKFGLPAESDLVFDVRFLKNPNYVKSLKYLTGLNPSVRRYVFAGQVAKRVLKMLKELVSFLIPEYIKEGKSYITLSVGCTGGHHRSVAVVYEMSRFIKGLGYEVGVSHRDKDKKLGE